MDFSKAGIILNTQNYVSCVDFYGRVLGLPFIQELKDEKDSITVFALGDIYLMIERGGHAHEGSKPIETCPTKLRFNVQNVQAKADILKAKGVRIEVREHDWGTTAEFADPDGNRCALRSERGFGRIGPA